MGQAMALLLRRERLRNQPARTAQPAVDLQSLRDHLGRKTARPEILKFAQAREELHVSTERELALEAERRVLNPKPRGDDLGPAPGPDRILSNGPLARALRREAEGPARAQAPIRYLEHGVKRIYDRRIGAWTLA